MPPTTTVPRIRREAAPDPLAAHKGRQPTMNAKAVITISQKTQAGSVQRGIADAFAAFVVHLRKFDDKDYVFGRESNEHYEPDGRKDVVFKMSGHAMRVTRPGWLQVY